jgi:hypothetical protein
MVGPVPPATWWIMAGVCHGLIMGEMETFWSASLRRRWSANDMKMRTLRRQIVVISLSFLPFLLNGVENRVQLWHDGTNTCVYLYGQPLSRDLFKKKLETIGGISANIRFGVQVSRDIPFRDVVEYGSVMQDAGVTNLVVEMREWGDSSSPPQVRFGLLPPKKTQDCLPRLIIDGRSRGRMTTWTKPRGRASTLDKEAAGTKQ